MCDGSERISDYNLIPVKYNTHQVQGAIFVPSEHIMCIRKRYLSRKELCKVTFILPERLSETATTAYIAGEFNNWDTTSTRMKKVKGRFVRSMKLPSNRAYQFRYFINGSRWENDPEADSQARGFSGTAYNSVITV